MRKKIPTITRPDPAYAATLQQCDREVPGKDDEAQVTATKTGTPAVDLDADRNVSERAPEGAVAPHQVTAESSALHTSLRAPVSARALNPTRKIDIRVNALERQEAALEICGVEPAHVVRAALRRAVKGWQLSPVFAPVAEERRTRNTQWQARTSLAVDAASLGVLLRDHDPLDVLSKWALIRGQVEPRIWGEIDKILEEIAVRAASQHEPNAP
ncbi:hypothetical protein HKX23_16825 [Sulfitobacter sp. KE29]|uniref:hypothetical protein n=1 Tax=unclassified Sulfitobacter TaxID=196795 RepID=UPI0023E204D4|nr:MULTISPECIES: hypothetical protein [unclassified Sulfitobacter]MDF3420015.1 hypothetical protein [Sulfitobacter sp. Ks38]MDF3427505.1 hypothetical protein [Sulfitobacter sp. KE29]MDF3431078.1 hypothetical protein [Sulfitobacter sp. S46]MDF3445818.1 hypothetical protein [Sulfitobacter sp. KE31]MDF3549747.1 hypothetical protein [Sulfitobacter sp. KE28]